MNRKTNRRSRAVMLVLVVVALATAGVVYAHWTETLTVDATVASGNAEMRFTSAATDDDHVANTWETVQETVAQEGTEYDRWPGTSSNDPSSAIGGSRYTKDVARCRVTARTNQTVTVLVENAYPSYWCTIRGDQQNVGSVPMKDQVLRVEVCEADCGLPANWVVVPYDTATDRFWFDSSDGDSDDEIMFANRPQNWCGRQFDPGYAAGWQVWFHILQDAAQSATYQVRFTSEWVNWNEWSLGACAGYNEWGNGSGTLKYPITP